MNQRSEREIMLVMTPEQAIMLRQAIASAFVTMHEHNQKPWADLIQKLDGAYRDAVFAIDRESKK